MMKLSLSFSSLLSSSWEAMITDCSYSSESSYESFATSDGLVRLLLLGRESFGSRLILGGKRTISSSSNMTDGHRNRRAGPSFSVIF